MLLPHSVIMLMAYCFILANYLGASASRLAPHVSNRFVNSAQTCIGQVKPLIRFENSGTANEPLIWALIALDHINRNTLNAKMKHIIYLCHVEYMRYSCHPLCRWYVCWKLAAGNGIACACSNASKGVNISLIVSSAIGLMFDIINRFLRQTSRRDREFPWS